MNVRKWIEANYGIKCNWLGRISIWFLNIVAIFVGFSLFLKRNGYLSQGGIELFFLIGSVLPWLIFYIMKKNIYPDDVVFGTGKRNSMKIDLSIGVVFVVLGLFISVDHIYIADSKLILFPMIVSGIFFFMMSYNIGINNKIWVRFLNVGVLTVLGIVYGLSLTKFLNAYHDHSSSSLRRTIVDMKVIRAKSFSYEVYVKSVFDNGEMLFFVSKEKFLSLKINDQVTIKKFKGNFDIPWCVLN